MMSLDTIMSTDLKTISPGANLADARALMHDNRIHHLPVVDDDHKLVGLTTLTNLLVLIDHLVVSFVLRRRIRTFRQAIEHADRTLRFDFGASQIAERCRQIFQLLIPISEHQVAIAFLEVVTTSDFTNIRSHQRRV